MERTSQRNKIKKTFWRIPPTAMESSTGLHSPFTDKLFNLFVLSKAEHVHHKLTVAIFTSLIRKVIIQLVRCCYRKRQKLSERKVSWFTRFHSNVEKTFVAQVIHLY